jgi:hypothetical protein
MNKNYKIKFRHKLVGGKRFWGFEGHTGPQSWNETVELIAKHGIGKIQYVQHCDKDPKNYKRLTGKEMLSLWQAVAAN